MNYITFLCFFCYTQGLQITVDKKDIDSLMRISGRMECESPNRHLYEFVGNIRLDGHRYEKIKRLSVSD